MKKKGKNYLGLCPFHKENTPSFTVSPDKQIYHCFGCHAGGNVFTFIQKIERLEFNDSVRFLADLSGITIENKARESSPAAAQAVTMNNMALASFRNYLQSPAGTAGMDYLTKRGVLPETMETFQLGYTPDSWDFLVTLLKKNGLPLDTAVRYGLIALSEKEGRKRYYDRFRGRIMFPICDSGGRPVAFGGRVIGQGEPKYLNSPESDIFKKRQILYGFHLAREHIREVNRAIIVEGYLDVIACHQRGIQNVVAPLGTALTEEHLLYLSRYCTEVILIFDADSAGESASLRTLSKIDDVNLEVKVGVLPKGEDPFDLIQKQGERAFMAIVDSAMKPVDYRLARIVETLGKKGTIAALLESFAVIKEIPYETERSEYLKKISFLLNVDENTVRKDYISYRQDNKGMTIATRQKETAHSIRDQYLTRSYRDLLKLLCRYPGLIDKAAIDFSEDNIPDAGLKMIFGSLMKLYSQDETFSVDKLFDIFNNGPEMDFLNECLNADFTFDDPDAVYTEIYINLRLFEIDDKIESCVNLVKTKKDNLDDYLSEIEVLKREKEKLNNYLQNKQALLKHL